MQQFKRRIIARKFIFFQDIKVIFLKYPNRIAGTGFISEIGHFQTVFLTDFQIPGLQ